MPIYEYRCDHCGHELETIQKVNEAPLKHCPACATEGLRKKISAAVFRLKGGGWYETDFKSDKKKNVAGDDNGGDKGTDNGAQTEKQGTKKESGSDKPSSSGATEGKSKSDSAGAVKSATSPAAKE